MTLPSTTTATYLPFSRNCITFAPLRANPAQPPKGKDPRGAAAASVAPASGNGPVHAQQPPRTHRRKRGGRDREQDSRGVFATELAKVL